MTESSIVRVKYKDGGLEWSKFPLVGIAGHDTADQNRACEAVRRAVQGPTVQSVEFFAPLGKKTAKSAKLQPGEVGMTR